MTKKLKIMRYLTGLLVILSLFTSTVFACDCAHHQENHSTEVSSSCHDESSTHSKDNQFNENLTVLGTEAVCVCAVVAPQASVKSDILKVEKQIAATPVVLKSVSFFQSSPQTVKFFFEKSGFLTDSFYNLTPGRAPPTHL